MTDWVVYRHSDLPAQYNQEKLLSVILDAKLPERVVKFQIFPLFFPSSSLPSADIESILFLPVNHHQTVGFPGTLNFTMEHMISTKHIVLGQQQSIMKVCKNEKVHLFVFACLL